MRLPHRASILLVALSTSGLLAASLASPAPAQASSGWSVAQHLPARMGITRAGKDDGRRTTVLPTDRIGRSLATGAPLIAGEHAQSLTAQPRVASASVLSHWAVTYGSGFTGHDDAKASFQRAVDIWSHTVASSVTIQVDAQLTAFSDAAQLGGAGPQDFASNSGIYFPIALANSLAGRDLQPSRPDIGAEFSSDADLFYYGADPSGLAAATCTGPSGSPEAGTCYDFESVVLHELGHGLGFVGSADSNGSGETFYGYDFASQDANPANDSSPLVYDLFTETSDGTAILSYPNDSAELTDALTSNVLYWDGPEGATADRGREPRLYAPASGFEPGSSYSHLSDASYPSGDPDALMTPFAEPGDITRDPGEVMLGMFRDMGWVTPTIAGSTYVPLARQTPVFDTHATVPTGTLKDVVVAGSFGVPSTATAVVLNLTSTAISANAQLSAYAKPRSGPLPPLPRVTNLVAAKGSSRDAFATVPLGFGAVRFATLGGTSHASAAVAGYYLPTGGSKYGSATVRRILDTRTGKGITRRRIGTGAALVKLGGSNGIPANATAVVVDMTGISPTNTSTLELFSSALSSPSSGSIHLSRGQSATNLVVVTLGPGGYAKLRTTLGATDVVLDLAGWYAPSGTLVYRPVLPQRLFGPLTIGATTHDDKPVGQLEGFGIPANATGLILNTVASAPTATTYLSTYASGAFPGTTSLTVTAGKSASGPSITRPSAGGNVRVKNAAGSTAVSLDLFGYFAP